MKPLPALAALGATLPGVVVKHAPTSGRLVSPSPLLLLAVSGVREPDPRWPSITTEIHLLEPLVLMLSLRTLSLGEEESFFIAVVAFQLMVFG